MLWRFEEANFPNPKEIAFSCDQNNIDGTSSVLVSWKIEFSESETSFCRSAKVNEAISVLPTMENRIFRIRNKSPFHRTKATFKQFSAFWRPQKRIFRIGKKSLFCYAKANFQYYDALKKRIFHIRKKTLFQDAKTTLTRILALWCLQKLNFPNQKQKSILHAAKQTWSNFLCFDAMKKRVFRIQTKSLFHGAKKLWRDFQLFGALKEGNFTNVKEIAFSWR